VLEVLCEVSRGRNNLWLVRRGSPSRPAPAHAEQEWRWGPVQPPARATGLRCSAGRGKGGPSPSVSSEDATMGINMLTLTLEYS